RVANLPTVWSNRLAGWILGGRGYHLQFFWLCLGATFIYVSGMFWNDAYDAQFDKQFRPERPIPSGKISLKAVWIWGAIWLALGVISLAWMGRLTGTLTFFLIGSIVLYDAIHKNISFAPVLMAACRFFLYLIAASVTTRGVSGLVIWSALALSLYIVGLGYLARRESAPGSLRYWPCYFLGAPILLSVMINDGPFLQTGLLFSAVLGLWICFCLRYTFWKMPRNISATISGLLAGIVWVDLLSVAGATPKYFFIFIGLFLAARVCQKFSPAT
ncbi:MAG: UbiA family prenyltransferase, partial [Limisphaerales bacterium]